MDQRERIGDLQTAVQVALSAFQSELWTALPGEVQSFDPVAMTCVVQPTIKGKVRDRTGAMVSVAMPLLLDCPVHFPAGGGCTLTFPLKKGDECLVVFASRCIDGWWQSGGIQEQAEFRMHDLSDGFAFVGFRSQPHALANVSTSATQLRSDDGQAYVQLNPTSHEIDVVTPGNWSAQIGGATNITVTGNATINAQNVAVSARATASVTAPSITLGASGQSLLSFVTSAFMSLFNGHTHTSASPGSPTSTPLQTMDASHTTSTVKGG